MQPLNVNENILKLESQITRHLVEKLPSSLRFHNVLLAYRIMQGTESILKLIDISKEESNEIRLACKFLICGFRNTYNNFEIASARFAEVQLNKLQFDQKTISRISSIIKNSIHPNECDPLGSFVLHDVYWSFLASDDFGLWVEKLYEESLLHSYGGSRKAWYQKILTEWKEISFKTPPGIEIWATKKQANLKKLEGKIQQMPSEEGSRLLNIRESELQELVQKLKTSKKKIGRGIQTMFRLTSRNHFTLNQMVDRKANIMITVNTILLSLIVGGFIGDFEGRFAVNHIPFLILVITTLLSIIFSVFSIQPEITHGEFTEEEIRNKLGNLLFYGNFHKMSLRDYEWGMLQVMNDPDYLYLSMVRDIYYLGKALSHKHKMLRMSLRIFMIGLVLAVMSFILLGII